MNGNKNHVQVDSERELSMSKGDFGSLTAARRHGGGAEGAIDGPALFAPVRTPGALNDPGRSIRQPPVDRPARSA